MDTERELPAFTDAPDEQESRQLTVLGRKLYSVDAEIQRLEKALELKKTERYELTMHELPDYFKKIGQDKLGLPEFNVDLVLENYYHANIAADWDEERRTKAFEYLEKRGDGDLIKTQVVLYFGRHELWKVRWVQATLALLREKLVEAGSEAPEIPAPVISMAIPWNTLTAFVKEQVELGKTLELETIGAVVGSVVKIKARKK